MTTSHSLLGLLAAATLSFFAIPAFAGGPTLAGTVLGDDGAEQVALANVRIDITPLGPIKGKKKAPVDDLVGVSTSTPLGKFRIGELSSPSEGVEYPLLKNWRYKITIVAAGYYEFNQELEVTGKGGDYSFIVKSHDYTIVDTTGGAMGGNETLSTGGKVVRGG